jgi:hypothetical protein
MKKLPDDEIALPGSCSRGERFRLLDVQQERPPGPGVQELRSENANVA